MTFGDPPPRIRTAWDDLNDAYIAHGVPFQQWTSSRVEVEPLEIPPPEVPVLRVWLHSGDWLDIRRLAENSEWHILLGLPDEQALEEAVNLPNALHGTTPEGRRLFIPWESIELLELVEPAEPIDSAE